MKIMLKNKFINHLLKNGNKKTCENILLKSFKKFQKKTKKPFKSIIQLSVINLTPIFRIITLKNKKNKKQIFLKEVPTFVTQEVERVSWGIKYLLHFTKTKISIKVVEKLYQEILDILKGKGTSYKLKVDYCKKSVLKKRFLTYFRW